MMTVPLLGKNAAGRVVRVDDGDFELVAPYYWHVKETLPRPGNRGIGPYAQTRVGDLGHGRNRGRSILMHKLITGWPMTDHIDHDGLNNQRYNLRPVTDQQNHFNRLPDVDTSSRFKGISWLKKERLWRASIMVSGQVFLLGMYASEIDAAMAYDTAAIEKMGEFACLNFPDGVPVTAREQIRAERMAAGVIHFCRICGTEFEAKRGSIFCSRKCCNRNTTLIRIAQREAERAGRLF